MAGSKVLQFFLLISLMIFSTHALTVFLTDGVGPSRFEYETEIRVDIGQDGRWVYNGRVRNDTYTAGPATTKVIVWIESKFNLERTMLQDGPAREAIRGNLAASFRRRNSELLYLAVSGFSDGDERLVGEFIHETIKPHPDQRDFQINTVGGGAFNRIYETSSGYLTQYVEHQLF